MTSIGKLPRLAAIGLRPAMVPPAPSTSGDLIGSEDSSKGGRARTRQRGHIHLRAPAWLSLAGCPVHPRSQGGRADSRGTIGTTLLQDQSGQMERNAMMDAGLRRRSGGDTSTNEGRHASAAPAAGASAGGADECRHAARARPATTAQYFKRHACDHICAIPARPARAGARRSTSCGG